MKTLLPELYSETLDASGGNRCEVLSPSPDQTTAGTFELDVDQQCRKLVQEATSFR